MDEQSERQLLDMEQIQMLVDAAGDDSFDLFEEILELYIQESREKLKEIQAYREAGNFQEVSLSAHALAGCSANIGALQVWQMAKEIENLSKDGRSEEALTLIDDLPSVHAASIRSLKSVGHQNSGS